ncbi:MAG: tRNA (uridine(34)/cytosine(34)/5-carboxymethylaminomethyluridine(34)-2'-O)-methyltransferase TrmL [Clostridia bacterium]|nr:tRNA (uridine(34)/cytosine(34)/5-carboxymethylaminomethyluridine(34)-2'-O)-methyltransferase TrmL [Clostridia bacterium]
MNIVLVEPEIPANTGNISRTCAVTGSHLHLVEPLGFSTDDRHLKRAGLDYWDKLDLTYYANYQQFAEQNHTKGRFWFLSKKAKRLYTEVQFQEEDFLIFGKETAGLPESLLQAYPEQCLRIPMRANLRSLNLSNSVALVLYEALRQRGFEGLI